MLRRRQTAAFARVQILNNQAYVVGETSGFKLLNLRNKQMLASVLDAFPGNLPDVDFVIQGSDWIPANLNNSGQFQRLDKNDLLRAFMIVARLWHALWAHEHSHHETARSTDEVIALRCMAHHLRHALLVLHCDSSRAHTRLLQARADQEQSISTPDSR